MAINHDEQVIETQTTSERVSDDQLREECPVTPRDDHRMNMAERFVWIIAGIIIGLLAFRFVLRLLGANPANGFADFVYTISHPFAAPFFSLFNYDQDLLNGGFELGTLVAIIVYALVAWMIAKLVTLGRR
ncbi:MAG: YggT family protein [Patescibacteria group bacterium]|nr:YggT family protein [Candidatus Saccharibacteria bacterium]MDQ5962919.1 YggT family protein [Patescibacteria group bacterium]